MSEQEEIPPPKTIELLTFQVGGQEYALDIMSVREIRGWTKATPLPHAPSFVRGVINLRGTVLTIVDLADRLGMGVAKTNERNVTIVVHTGKETVGLLVDAVSDILEINTDSLQNPSDISSTESEETFVSALTISNGRMIRVLSMSAALPVENEEAA